MTNDETRHMDLGETKTITKEKTVYGINFAPNEYFGTDVQSDDIRVSDVEVQEPEQESDLPNVKITWKAEVTKGLGRNWDTHNEPVTEAEIKQQRRQNILKKWTPWIVTGGAMALATAITGHLMESIAGVTINGEPMTPPTTVELLPPVIAVFLLSGLIMYGLKGGFPGMAGRARL